MLQPLPRLPVSEAIPELQSALVKGRSAVLAAPPGAGKTTLVPLHLLAEKWLGDGKIIMLEPRRLAARASARQMARLLGEKIGQTVGYRTRLDTRVSAATRIEVVTEGIFSRMIVDNPELPGISAVIFDEFHERSLDADFGLALALDIQSALRTDLRLLVMSATLDVARVARLLGDAAVVESHGRSYPVDVRYRQRPAGERIEPAMCAAVLETLEKETGSILAFLPGQGEIRRTADLLEAAGVGDAIVTPLYGTLPGKEQDAAIRPPEPGTRKIVLATSVAETSITIDGVRIVIDSGLQRLPVFEPATGITRLETVRVSQASANQRAGRAGRTEPGVAIRLWRLEQTAALPEFTPPQILASDLSGLLLDSAAWGVREPESLKFVDPPPRPAVAEARALLQSLGALDTTGLLTRRGEIMRGLGLAPRLAAIVVGAAQTATAYHGAELAVLLSEQGLGGSSVDIDERWRQLRGDLSTRAEGARKLARRIAERAVKDNPEAKPSKPAALAGPLLLQGFADRVARRRGDTPSGECRFTLANGRGAYVDRDDPLATQDMLVVADLTGRAASQRIRAAAFTDIATVESVLADHIVETDEVAFNESARAVKARRVRRLGSLVLSERVIADPPIDALRDAMVSGLETLGIDALPWTEAAKQLRSRIQWLYNKEGAPWPDLSDTAMLASVDLWFAPYQTGVSRFDRIDPAGIRHGMMAMVPFDLHGELDRLAPSHFITPAGSNLPINYEGDAPVLAVRVQEMFGLRQHPAVCGGQVPLILELLSPAGRPIQTTQDLPGFWAGSWAEVRGDMRGRYPKHAWPEDPASAEATRRVKHARKR
ncbi:MAG: ATP-dependent helicase HrpB [Pseudomonadota bacterium]